MEIELKDIQFRMLIEGVRMNKIPHNVSSFRPLYRSPSYRFDVKLYTTVQYTNNANVNKLTYRISVYGCAIQFIVRHNFIFNLA